MVAHVFPEHDLFEHVTDGGPCPCQAQEREHPDVIVHNSYDGREIAYVLAHALETLRDGVETIRELDPEEMCAYRHAHDLLTIHYPEVTIPSHED